MSPFVRALKAAWPGAETLRKKTVLVRHIYESLICFAYTILSIAVCICNIEWVAKSIVPPSCGRNSTRTFRLAPHEGRERDTIQREAAKE